MRTCSPLHTWNVNMKCVTRKSKAGGERTLYGRVAMVSFPKCWNSQIQDLLCEGSVKTCPVCSSNFALSVFPNSCFQPLNPLFEESRLHGRASFLLATVCHGFCEGTTGFL